MQQVPDPGDCASSDSATSTPSSSSHVPRWSRIPRMQLLRNRNDQRVPFYIDQTVPVWPLRQTVRRGSSHSSNNTSPSSRSPAAILVAERGTHQQQQGNGNGSRSGSASQSHSQSHHRGGYGVAKPARKFAGISQTAWFRSIRGALKMTNADAHTCNVSEILRDCSCETTTNTATKSSSKWSGIEQDLFTCTAVDPKVFVVPSATDLISNKKSKGKSQSEI